MKLDEVREIQKKTFIEALSHNMCQVTNACKVAGISWKTYYNWRAADPEFAEAVNEVFEMKKDDVEDALFDLIKKREPRSVIFAAKTLCKDRGYREEQAINLSADEPFEIKVN